VVSVVYGVEKSGLTPASGTAGLMGLLIAYGLWWGYFEGVRGATALALSECRHTWRYQVWLYAHLPLLMGITATAVGIRHLIRLSPHNALPYQEGWLLCLSVATCDLALDAISVVDFSGRSGQLHRYLIPHYVIAFFGMIVGAVSGMLQGITLLVILTFLCTAQIFFSLWGRPSSERE
jgi:low temperature requirement protein LtrA